MADAVFPFPGGKSRFASWILECVPEHTCFVEVFGGAAGVLANKDPDTSRVEVYNDRDGDLVQFFEVLRERPDELVAWLESVPFSREVQQDWAHKFYHGYRPSDEIERAGRFFALRYLQWGATYDSPGGFAYSKTGSKAQAFSNKTERLHEFAERFGDVTIENLDWRAVLDKYDGAETVFYLDPPYVDKEDYYLVGQIDHGELVERLGEVEGRWLLSYGELPDAFEGYVVLGRDEKRFINNGTSGSANGAREHLVLNFEPGEVST